MQIKWRACLICVNVNIRQSTQKIVAQRLTSHLDLWKKKLYGNRENPYKKSYLDDDGKKWKRGWLWCRSDTRTMFLSPSPIFYGLDEGARRRRREPRSNCESLNNTDRWCRIVTDTAHMASFFLSFCFPHRSGLAYAGGGQHLADTSTPLSMRVPSPSSAFSNAPLQPMCPVSPLSIVFHWVVSSAHKGSTLRNSSCFSKATHMQEGDNTSFSLSPFIDLYPKNIYLYLYNPAHAQHLSRKVERTIDAVRSIGARAPSLLSDAGYVRPE